MNSKITLNELTDLLSEHAKISKREANAFLKALFDTIETNLITDKLVKIKGLGTFKLIRVENRRIANVNTGEIQEIPGHYKTTFTPDADLAEAVNEPFGHLDTIILDDEIIADKPTMPEEEYLNELRNRPDLRTETDLPVADSTTESEEQEEILEEQEEATDDNQPEADAETAETGLYQLSQSTEVSMPDEDEDEKTIHHELPTTEEDFYQKEKETEEQIPTAHLPYTPQEYTFPENNDNSLTQNEDDRKTAEADTPILPEYDNKEADKPEDEDKEPEEQHRKRNSFRWFGWLILAALAGIGGFFGYTYIYGLFPFEKTSVEEPAIVISPRPAIIDTTTQTAPDTTLKDTTRRDSVQPEVKQRKTIAEQIEERQKAVRESAEKEKTTKNTLTTEKMVIGSRLTKIALKHYGNRIFWVYIYQANKDKIKDPNNVPTGITLDIPDKSVYQIDSENPESVKRAGKLAETILNGKY